MNFLEHLENELTQRGTHNKTEDNTATLLLKQFRSKLYESTLDIESADMTSHRQCSLHQVQCLQFRKVNIAVYQERYFRNK